MSDASTSAASTGSVPSRPSTVPEQRTEPASGRPRQPLDLVLEGGGVKGIGLAGAVIALDDAGYTFPRVAGTSAGAIAAALVAALQAAKRPLSELEEVLSTCEFPRFIDAGRVHAAADLVLHMGLYDGAYLVEWLGGALADIGVTTFGDLRFDDAGADATLTAAQRYTLVVHTADITRGRLARLPWDYPAYGVLDIDEVRIVDAVRASMAIPFFFTPVRVDAPRAAVDGVTYEAGAVTWVDGGLLSNFPVEVFDRADGAPARWGTVGIKLSARQTTVEAEHEVHNLWDEAVACLGTLLDNGDRYYLTSAKQERTIFVDNLGIGTTDFHLAPERQHQLFEQGRQDARAWVAQQTVAVAATTV